MKSKGFSALKTWGRKTHWWFWHGNNALKTPPQTKLSNSFELDHLWLQYPIGSMDPYLSKFSTATPRSLVCGLAHLCKVLVILQALQHLSTGYISHYKPAEQLKGNKGLNCSCSFTVKHRYECCGFSCHSQEVHVLNMTCSPAWQGSALCWQLSWAALSGQHLGQLHLLPLRTQAPLVTGLQQIQCIVSSRCNSFQSDPQVTPQLETPRS